MKEEICLVCVDIKCVTQKNVNVAPIKYFTARSDRDNHHKMAARNAKSRFFMKIDISGLLRVDASVIHISSHTSHIFEVN